MNLTRLSFDAIAVTLALGAVSLTAAAPLAHLDFGTGESRHLRVVGKHYPIVTLDGHRLLDLSRGPESIPLEWPATMPNPGFPGLAGVTPAPARAPLRLVLDLDQETLGLHGAQDLALLITVYDLCEGNGAANSTEVQWTKADPKSPRGAIRITVSGSPYATEVVARPRLLTKTVPIYSAALTDSQEGGDFLLAPASRLYVQRVEVYPLPPSPLDARTSRREEGMISYPHYRPPASVLDLWQKDLSDLIVRQAQAYTAAAEAKMVLSTRQRQLQWRGARREELRRLDSEARALQDSAVATTVPMDAFYYQGQIALVQKDEDAYRRLLAAATDSLNALQNLAQQRLQTILLDSGVPWAPNPDVPPTSKDRPSPLDRVLFTTFANSPWDYWDPYNATGRYLSVLGVHSKMLLTGAPALREDGLVDEASREHFERSVQRERARGFDMLLGVGHHGFHLTEHSGLPPWLIAQAVPESLYDVTAAGKALTAMDLWNPHVRKYFLDTVTALARSTARNPHLLPWYYWGEPACASGYTPAARQAFRAYLKDKYREVGVLNATWGSNYGTLEEIQPPPPPGATLRRQAGGLTYDFERFRRDSFTQWWRDTAAALRRGDPRARLWLEGWGRYDYLLSHGMDQLGMFDAGDLSSAHTGGAADVMRVWGSSLAAYSGTAFADGETLTCGDYFQGFANLQELQAAAEQHLLASTWYGVRAFMFWTSTLGMAQVYSYGGPQGYDGSYLPPLSPVAGALRTVRRKADLYDPLVKSTRIVPSPVGILYSSTSFLNGWPYNEVEHETLPIHGWLFSSDYGYRYAHEEAVADGREDLRSFRVLVAPWAVWLRPQVARALRDWVQQGGVLISSGPVGAYDEYGKPLNTILEAALGKVQVSYAADERKGDTALSADSVAFLRSIGDTHATHFGGWAWSLTCTEQRRQVRTLLALADGTPVVYEAPLGYGKVMIATGPLGKNGLRRLVMGEIEKWVLPLVRRGRDDALHVLPRRDLHGNLYLGVFNQDVRHSVTDTLEVEGTFGQIVERSVLGDCLVPSRPAGPRTALTLTLAPGESTVLACLQPQSPTRSPADPQGEVQPESPLVAWSPADAARAEREINGKQLPPAIRAEALALVLAAERYGALGYHERAQRLLTQALATTTSGRPAASPDDTILARRARSPVQIDGSADGWRDVPRFSVRGSGDSGGEFALQWDDRNLYLLAVVRDPDLRRSEESGGDYNWIWAYDGVLLVFNTANTAPRLLGGPLYDAKYQATQSALLVSITGRKYANSPGGVSAAPVRSAVQEIPNGYLMEVAIPLREIMLPPIAGANVGCQVRIVDHGREMGFGRFSDRENWMFDPLYLSRLELRD